MSTPSTFPPIPSPTPGPDVLLVIDRNTRYVVGWTYMNFTQTTTQLQGSYDLLQVATSTIESNKMISVAAGTNVISFSDLPLGWRAAGPTIDGMWAFGS